MNKRNNPIKRRDMGLAGFGLLVSQFLTSYQSTHSVTKELRDLQDSVHTIKTEQEKVFAKKTEIVAISKKISRLNEELISINEQIKLIRSDYAMNSSPTALRLSRHVLTCPTPYTNGRKNASFEY